MCAPQDTEAETFVKGLILMETTRPMLYFVNLNLYTYIGKGSVSSLLKGEQFEHNYTYNNIYKKNEKKIPCHKDITKRCSNTNQTTIKKYTIIGSSSLFPTSLVVKDAMSDFWPI